MLVLWLWFLPWQVYGWLGKKARWQILKRARHISPKGDTWRHSNHIKLRYSIIIKAIWKIAQTPTYKFLGVGKCYLLLTFMLPNADGCGTGLQLSAKEVVLGRPDIFQSNIPPVSQSLIGLLVLWTNPLRPTATRLAPTEIKRKMCEFNSAVRGPLVVFFSELSTFCLAFRSFSLVRFSKSVSNISSDEASNKFRQSRWSWNWPFPSFPWTKPTYPRLFLTGTEVYTKKTVGVKYTLKLRRD